MPVAPRPNVVTIWRPLSVGSPPSTCQVSTTSSSAAIAKRPVAAEVADIVAARIRPAMNVPPQNSATSVSFT